MEFNNKKPTRITTIQFFQINNGNQIHYHNPCQLFKGYYIAGRIMKIVLPLIIFTFSLFAYGQEKESPSIVILNSQETIIPMEMDSIAKLYVKEGLSEQEKKVIREENGNFKLKAEKEIEFLKETDITSSITYGLNYFLSYKFYEYFPDLLIYPAKETNQSDLKSLSEISKKHDVNWVVNLKKVEFLINEKENSAIIKFQLFNQKTNQILLEKEVKVDDSNSGFEFACQSGTIDCVINNSISRMSYEIMAIMGKEKKYWR